MTSILKRNVAMAVVAVAVAGGGAAAFAAEQPSRPTLAAQARAQAAPTEGPEAADSPEGSERRERREARAAGRHRGAPRPAQRLARRAVHGDLIVRGEGGEFEDVTFDRGELTTVSDGSLTLERPDGVTVTVTLNDATRYRGVASAGELRTGRPVFVVSKDGTATQVAQRPEREAEGAAEGSGSRVPIANPTR